MVIKKVLLWVGISAILAVVAIIFVDDRYEAICRGYTNSGHTVKYCETAILALFPIVVTFLFSLITYKMRDEVFRYWWNFISWWVPLSVGTSLYIGSIGPEGKYPGANGHSLTPYYIYHGRYQIFFLIYAVLVAVSLWRIVRKHRQLKREGK